MTHTNWQIMADKEIAGDESVTCFVAALDCLLSKSDIPYKTYAMYHNAYIDQIENGPCQRRTRYTIKKVLESSIGSSCLKNIITKRASDLFSFIEITQNALIGNKKIIIFVSPSHVVGLKSESNNLWKMVGNSVPCDDFLTIEEVFDFLHIPPCAKKKRNRTNIYLIN